VDSALTRPRAPLVDDGLRVDDGDDEKHAGSRMPMKRPKTQYGDPSQLLHDANGEQEVEPGPLR